MEPPPSTRPHAPGKTPALLTLTAGLSAALLVPLLSPAAAEAVAITASETYNPVLVVDAGTASTSLTISGLINSIANVTTTINLTKCDDPIDSATGACLGGRASFNEEIGLALQSPFGTVVDLIRPSSGLGGQTPGDTVTWTFTDSALGGIGGNRLVSGTYLPSSPLSAFNRQAGNGTWTLFFTDDVREDPLSINNWSLTVTPVPGPLTPVPGPLPILGAAAAFGFSRKLRKRLKSSKPEVISTTAV